MNADDKTIVGTMVENDPGYERKSNQEDSWFEQIRILKEQFKDCDIDKFLFEYTIPRMGKRVDNILFHKGIVFVVEFKVGSDKYSSADLDQAHQYAIDLKNFQDGSSELVIIPILVATNAPDISNTLDLAKDKVARPLKANAKNLGNILINSSKGFSEKTIDVTAWEKSVYQPTPTTIEAATALYEKHSVEEITRRDTEDRTFDKTVKVIDKIISHSKENSEKSIIFLTGIPGSGKTLVGLDIAANKQDAQKKEHGIYLCGTADLVEVIQEALTRNRWDNLPFKQKKDGSYSKKLKTESKSKIQSDVKTFFQYLPYFREEAVTADDAPHERIAVFDEAQRMWDAERVDKELVKRNIIKSPEGKSESDHLIGYMDKHDGWAIIVCMIGGGQEIHKGEDGTAEWFKSIKNNFPDWQAYLSTEMTTPEYIRDQKIKESLKGVRYSLYDLLHLKSATRSFRSPEVSLFVNALLDKDKQKAKQLKSKISQYDILVTRNLDAAKTWTKKHRRGLERAGLFTSSYCQRLRVEGITPLKPNDFQTVEWWLDSADYVNSSQYLEIPATEFGCQGLEVDWAIVGWDLCLRHHDNKWQYKRFSRKQWVNIDDEQKQRYLLNSFRVVLTRARQGMVVFIPKGSPDDPTRNPKHYDAIYNYLKEVGIEDL